MARCGPFVALAIAVILDWFGVTAQVCLRTKLTDDNTKFLDADGQVVDCEGDLVYEKRQCGCRNLISGYAEAEPCEPEVMIDFANGEVMSQSGSYVQSINVDVLGTVSGSNNGFAGVFNGVDSKLIIPLFQGTEWGARFKVNIRFMADENVGNLTQGLLGNSGIQGIQPTFSIAYSPSRQVVFTALDTGVFKVLQVPVRRGAWNEVVFDYNAFKKDAFLQTVGIAQTREMMTGNLIALNAPLVIGFANTAAHFKGKMDFIRVSRCG